MIIQGTATAGEYHTSQLAAKFTPFFCCAEPSEKVLPESQCGFRKERSTIDTTFVPRLVQVKCREQYRDLFTVFVSHSKAFDTVGRKFLWKVLGKIGCPPKLITVIRAFHQEFTMFLQLVRRKTPSVLLPCSGFSVFNLFVSAVLHIFHGNPKGGNRILVC